MLKINQLKDMTSFARDTAYQAGKKLLRWNKRRNRISFKGRVNLVTEADVASEKLITKMIIKKYPEHSILAEEEKPQDKKSDFRWVIDPLDGTTNFAHDFPFYCVSIALEYEDEMVAGAIYDPVRDEMFHAYLKGGSYLNGKKISVSKQARLEKSLLATGFPYDIGSSNENNLKQFNKFARLAQAVRRPGAAALDLCYLACGRIDGFWELKLHPWDTAAAKVIIEEARGKVTDFEGQKYSIYDKYILATNGKIHNQMKTILTSF
jgi:myo-inositol-1(or 4)-monophosphatase